MAQFDIFTFLFAAPVNSSDLMSAQRFLVISLVQFGALDMPARISRADQSNEIHASR
jgi:hypothetical protein